MRRGIASAAEGDDDALSRAISSSGRASFIKQACRAFALGGAAMGDAATASKLVSMIERRGRWSAKDPGVIEVARHIWCPVSAARIETPSSQPAAEGCRQALVNRLSACMRTKDAAGAVAAARALSRVDPLSAFAVLRQTDNVRGRAYVEMLDVIGGFVAGDETAVGAILEAAAASAAGWLRPRMSAGAPDLSHRVRVAALQCIRPPVRSEAGVARAARPIRAEEGHVKSVDVDIDSEAGPSVEVVKIDAGGASE